MANVNRDGGLRLYKSGVDQPAELCLHASGDTVRLGKGDPVKTAGSSGQIGGGPYTKTVALCASGDPIYGVVVGVQQHTVLSSVNLNRTHCPASTAMYVLVRPANHQDVYSITEDGTWAAADIGENANLTGNGGGTTITECDQTTGMSTVKLDTSTHATTATLQVKTVGFEPRPDNTPASANASILVRLNNIELSGSTGTDGV